jgi:hypothetical protein
MTVKEFAFDEAPNTAAFTCKHVLDGCAILLVSHDDDGSWQFLCGADHATAEGRIICLEEAVLLGPEVNQLAGLRCGWQAVRSSVAETWRRIDPHEEFIRRCVANPGWAVLKVPEGNAGEPAFAYTVGLYRNYQHAELILVGLGLENMHTMLDEVAGRIKAGERFVDGVRIPDVVEGYEVRAHEVRAVVLPPGEIPAAADPLAGPTRKVSRGSRSVGPG